MFTEAVELGLPSVMFDASSLAYDANVAATRDRFGTIPGATLLSSDDNYPLSVLPPNKHATLVFYCANTH